MSNRRRPRNQRHQRAKAPVPAPSANPWEGMEPFLWAMQDADEAEARGDAAGALKAMNRRPVDHRGRPCWRPERVDRLLLIDALGDDVPGWVVSRWILGQAAQALYDDERVRTAHRRAREIAGEISGLTGAAVEQAHIRLMDHDWFYRQVLLFEAGGLEHFLADVATPDLVAQSDRVREWAAAPMGGFEYVGARGAVATWTDLATGEVLCLPEIGSGCMLKPGLHAIGRLVPTQDGPMFESAPIETPYAVAHDVALDPPAWLRIVRDAGEVFREGDPVAHVESFPVATDVAEAQWLLWLTGFRQERVRDLLTDGRRLVRAVLDRATAELGATEHLFFPAELQERFGVEEQPDWEPWACLGAALLHPLALDGLALEVTERDLEVLSALGDRVAAPVREWITTHLDGVAAAA